MHVGKEESKYMHLFQSYRMMYFFKFIQFWGIVILQLVHVTNLEGKCLVA